MPSLFAVIEGIDRSGKTTLLQGLMALLSQKGIKATSFKEPGDDNPIGRAFREVSRGDESVPPMTIVCLLAAERYWRSEQVSRWLKGGYVVLADRYYLSGMVYCRAVGVSFERFYSIHRWILKPHLYIYLDLPISTALERRGKATDMWERTELVRRAARLYPQAFRYVGAEDDSDVCVIDASKHKSDVLYEAFLCLSHKAHL